MMLFVFILFLFQNQITMNSEPSNPEKVSFSPYAEIKNGNDGFYWGIASTVDEKGRIIVYDIGNKKVRIFNTNDEKLLEFGKAGSGPGEFYTRNISSVITTIKDRILIMEPRKLHLFDYNGDLIKDITLNFNYTECIVIETEFGFRLQLKEKWLYSKNKYVLFDYSSDGDLLKEKLRDDYVEVKMEKIVEADHDPKISEKAYFTMPNSFKQFDDGFIYGRNGVYQIEVLDNDLKITTILSRPFERIRMEKKTAEVLDWMKNKSKSDIAMILKEQQAYIDAAYEVYGGYKSDIQKIIGVQDGYIFALIADDDEEFDYIDVISPDYEFIDQLKVDGSNQAKDHQVVNHYVLIHHKNDTVGPFIKVYQINFN